MAVPLPRATPVPNRANRSCRATGSTGTPFDLATVRREGSRRTCCIRQRRGIVCIAPTVGQTGWVGLKDDLAPKARLSTQQAQDRATEATPSSGDILQVENVSVVFDGFKALDDLTFSMRAGELRVVIG